MQAHADRTAHLRASEVSQERRSRWAWLRDGERATPLLSSLTKPPKASTGIAAIQVDGGAVVTRGRAIAASMASHYAAVSAAQPTDAAARAAVLDVVRQGSAMRPADAAAVGDPVVTEQEVALALRSSKRGTAPGPNAVPLRLWQAGGHPMRLLLARLFTAIGRTRTVPSGFLDGLVISLLKPHCDPLQRGAYRPITLLNSEYRLLAKLLATRLGRALAPVIGANQTAFIPGRRICDNVLLLQLLPYVIQSDGEGPRGAAVVFVDIAKAYDSLDRDFLLSSLS